MGFLVSSDSSFLRTPGSTLSTPANYIATVDTSFLTLGTITNTATVGTAYSSQISVNGTGPYTSSVINGTLPAGLNLTSSTRTIAGTPTTPGTYNFDIQVFDAVDATQIQSYFIVVTSAEVNGSGIYKIVPNQTHDEIYTSIPTTHNVAIAPFIETYLAGDE